MTCPLTIIENIFNQTNILNLLLNFGFQNCLLGLSTLFLLLSIHYVHYGQS